ncbi:unnamed protein product [Citrullus colocynthis]|uniref:Uncharacterized protein n=1 Tax=Citrullus colocynthis TaxID=252529 RepID=A0ABP0YQW7_9ROSI
MLLISGCATSNHQEILLRILYNFVDDNEIYSSNGYMKEGRAWLVGLAVSFPAVEVLKIHKVRRMDVQYPLVN